MHAAVGDRILYDHPSRGERSINGEDYVIIHEEQHVLAVIEPARLETTHAVDKAPNPIPAEQWVTANC